MNWLIGKIGLRAALWLGLALALSGMYGVHRFNEWREARSLAHQTARADRAEAERDVARADADTGDKTADASKGARDRNDDVIVKVRAATAARVERPVVASPAGDAVRLRDEAAAVADYQSAADRLRGASAR